MMALSPSFVVSCLQGFERAAHADTRVMGRMQIDFRRGDVGMAQQILHVADADAAGQQMRGE